MNDLQNLANAIRERRIALGYMTRQEFATAASLSVRTINYLENAQKGNFDSVTRLKVVKALRWDPHIWFDLLDGLVLQPGVEQHPLAVRLEVLLSPDSHLDAEQRRLLIKGVDSLLWFAERLRHE